MLHNIIIILKTESDELKALWYRLEDIPFDEDQCLSERFHIWEKGTDKYDIWQWFDKRLPGGLGEWLHHN
jgi:hypothetical protein